MNQIFQGWQKVKELLCTFAEDPSIELNDGQKASLRAVAERLSKNGVIIADEVGMGKTRIAASVARAVIESGGRVAILVPPGLGYQWSDELQTAGVKDVPPILRSLDGFLNAWSPEDNEHIQPWAERTALLISHAFCNWQIKSNTRRSWKWSLLPKTLALVQASLLRESRKLPKGTKNNTELNNDERITKCAKWILDKSNNEQLKKIAVRDGFDQWGTNSPLFKPENYLKHTEYRRGLENVIGLGLGNFDLIIIDEAHKNRGSEGNLERLLKNVVAVTMHARSLAMTATPVELDATQWTQMLERIWVDDASKTAATTDISNYAKSVTRVRQCPSDENVREEYKNSSESFEKALKPYLLRRDKRQDPAVIKFQNASGEGYHAYRREQEILIDTAKLPPEWKRAVCAAEALSFVARQSDKTTAKRLRLTLGNGHGIASLIDQLQRDDKEGKKQSDEDEKLSNNESSESKQMSVAEKKRQERTKWWQNVITQPFEENDGSALFDHPAILAAVEEIEVICRRGEKVLVFGRFTRPLRALVQLLNAREMLRCLDNKQPWPQSKVHENDNWNAIVAAHRQLERQGKLDPSLLNSTLAEQYQALENQRRNIRENLIRNIEKSFSNNQPDKRVRELFNAFKKSATEISEEVQNNDDHALAVVARAIQELIGANIENSELTDIFAKAFVDLVAAASDRDEGDADGDGQLDEAEASDLWAKLKIRLHEEYNSPEGGYARLMYGETKPATRRFLQLAFNRKNAHPKVLVAQSMVGREGLNLHKACRTVVLLHPEWNPGVVEQQIGRVDRIGSLWEEKLNQAIADKQAIGDLPRIEIRPVIFKGTYDEKNWQVLHERWDDLRAQLHGVIISPRIAEKYVELKEIIDEINSSAPCFSPEHYIWKC